jgi:hypothetical protein
MMEGLFTKIENLGTSIKGYVNTRIESAKLTAAAKASAIAANAIAGIVVIVMFLFFLFLASTALAIIIGIWIGKTWAGFLIVGGFYLLIGLITWAARSRLIRVPVMNALIRELFSGDEENK